MKKFIAATTALLLTIFIAPAYLFTTENANGDDSVEIYPTQFISELTFDNLVDYAFNGDVKAFAENTSSGAVLYILEPDSYGDNQLTTVVCEFQISDIEYDDDILYLLTADNAIYSYENGSFTSAIHFFDSDIQASDYISISGYLYIFPEASSGAGLGLMVYYNSAFTDIFIDNCSQIKQIGSTLYVVNDGKLYSIYEATATELSFSYIDLTIADNISSGNAAEILKSDGYEVRMVNVLSRTTDGGATYITEIDISEIGSTFTTLGTTRLNTSRTGLAIADVGNATIVIMPDDDGEGSCFITLTSAIEEISYTPTESSSEAYATGDTAIYSRPYASNSTFIMTVPSGTMFTTIQQIEIDFIDDVFYMVTCTVDGQEIQGYVISRSLSEYTFAADNSEQFTTGTEDFTYENNASTVIIILIIVLLVLIAIGYIVFYVTGKKRSDKSDIPPPDDDLYIKW